MNLILALILAIIILLCMFLIPNKLIAVTIVLIIIIMLILARPGDFTLDHSYIMSHQAPQTEEKSAESEQESEETAANSSNILPGVPTPESQNFKIDTGAINFDVMSRDPMDMAVSTIGDVINGMNLTENNVDKIGNTLENIDWGNILVKSLNRLQKYSENNGVNGVNNSKLNNNSATVESGSSANVESGSSATVESGSPANVESGSPEITTTGVTGTIGTSSAANINGISNSRLNSNSGTFSGENSLENDTSSYCDNSKALNFGSDAACEYAPNDTMASSYANVESGSPENGSPENGSPANNVENGSPSGN